VSLLRNAEGRVRVPFVVGGFTLIAVATEFIFAVLLQMLGINGFETLDDTLHVFASSGTMLLSAFAATIAGWLLFRESTGLRDPLLHARFGFGFLIGAMVLAACCVVPALAGATTLRLGAYGPNVLFGAGMVQLISLAPAGFAEELFLRGLGFQALRRGTGDVAAVTLSSLVFGGLHLFNPNSSRIAVLAIALVGIWFGALTVRTGSVWTAMGVHVAWNFFEGFVFGQPVSGARPGISILVAGTDRGDPSFWSGGAFGPEAAGWTAVVLCIAIVLTLTIPKRSDVLT
jgi:hypothetical protein